VRVVGILLAAGRSERFGSDKLVAPLPHSSGDVERGTPIGVAACRHLIAAVPETIAVVRPGDDALSKLLGNTGARVVECAKAEVGMGASLACGVQSAADADGWIVALADMPWIESATIAAIVSALERGAEIVAPIFKGQRGHPVGFARKHYAALAELTADEGARAIIRSNHATVLLEATNDMGVVQDIDSPNDIS
jgi:molybdenum cofactor cytidylyltransferase